MSTLSGPVSLGCGALVLITVAGLAVLDSLNPSALAVTVYLLLATKPYVSRVLVYVGAVFVSYYVLGLLLFLGIDSLTGRLVRNVRGFLASDVGYIGQGVVGAALLAYGLIALRRHRPQRARRPRSHSHAAIALLGVIVTVAEIGTALPYLGAIGILSGAATPLPEVLLILAGYNLIMVAPPLLITLIYRLLGDRIADRLDSAGQWLMAQATSTWLNILAGAGALLVLNCLAHFEIWNLVG
jgi:cytochrome c biogenesis protein CcdA